MKKILLLLCLLLLTSCGVKQSLTVNEEIPTPAPTNPAPKGEEIVVDVPEAELPSVEPPNRTPEQEQVDKELIMLLREQLDGAYDVKGATFTYVYNKELNGKECFAYEMVKGEKKETFAVAIDSSAIYHLAEGQWVNIFNAE